MSYVCYSLKNGDILAVTNLDPKESFHHAIEWGFIEVDISEVIGILTGEESYREFIVEHSSVTNEKILKQRGSFKVEELDIVDIVYHIPTEEDYKYRVDEEGNTVDPDITIMQDIANTCWKIFIGKKLEQKLRIDAINLNVMLHFSVTEYNNPNVLYRTLMVDLEQLVKNHYQVLDFKSDYEFEGKPVSIFTVKRYDHYLYKVNNEQTV